MIGISSCSCSSSFVFDLFPPIRPSNWRSAIPFPFTTERMSLQSGARYP